MLQLYPFRIEKIAALVLLSFLYSCGDSQVAPPADPPLEARLLGGPCEGCEAVLEYGDRELRAVDTLPGFQADENSILLRGTVYQADGHSPAEGVVLYVYHTDSTGRYTPRAGDEGWAQKHGRLRTWLRTGEDGEYAFYTQMPAHYPNRTDPAHVHILVLEPDGKYYYLNSWHFVGDSLLTEKELHAEAPRGGSSGLVELRESDGILTAERDIILGKHIPDYR